MRRLLLSNRTLPIDSRISETDGPSRLSPAPFSVPVSVSLSVPVPGDADSAPASPKERSASSGSMWARRGRVLWERWGLVWLAFLLAGWLYSSPGDVLNLKRAPTSPLPWLASFWLVLGAIRLGAETVAGSARGAWVPRGWSFALGGGILAAGYWMSARNDWILPAGHQARWDCLLLRLWPFAAGIWMWFHARAVKARMSSAILGWGMPALILIPLAFLWNRLSFLTGARWRSLLSTADYGRWGTFSLEQVPLMAAAGLLIGAAMIAIPEIAYGLLERRSRARRAGGVAPPAALALGLFLALPIPIVPALAAGELWGPNNLLIPRGIDVLGQGMGVSSRSLCLLISVGLAAGLAALIREPKGRRVAAAWILAGALIAGWEFGLLGPGPSFVTLGRWAWGLVIVWIAAEAWAGRERRGQTAEETSEGASRRSETETERLPLPVETEALRALVRTSRSALRYWGGGTRRGLLRAAPPIFLLSLLAFVYLAFLASYSHGGGGGVSWLFPFIGHRGLDYWVVVLVVTLLLIVALPLGAIIPYKWVSRFGDVWTPNGLSELWLSLLRPWEIVWAVVVPPAYPWFHCIRWGLGASVVVIVLIRGGFGGDVNWSMLDYDRVNGWSGLVMIGSHALLTLGLLRRRILKGMAAFGLAASIVGLTALGAVLGVVLGLPSMARGTNLFFHWYWAFCCLLPALQFLLIGRWALASAAESMAQVARAE